MDISLPALFAGMVFSTVGFSLFLYGRKQGRAPQLIAGILLMVLPMLVPGALWITISSSAAIAGLWLAVRAGH